MTDNEQEILLVLFRKIAREGWKQVHSLSDYEVARTIHDTICTRKTLASYHFHRAGGWHGRSKSVYDRVLQWSMRHRWATVIVSLLVVLSTIPIAMNLGVNMIPRDDQSEMQVSFTAPEGFTLDRTDTLVHEIESRLLQLPGVVHRCTSIGRSGNAKGQGDVTRGSRKNRGLARSIDSIANGR